MSCVYVGGQQEFIFLKKIYKTILWIDQSVPFAANLILSATMKRKEEKKSAFIIDGWQNFHERIGVANNNMRVCKFSRPPIFASISLLLLLLLSYEQDG